VAQRRPGAPVALVYGHHDVQPVDPEALWEHPPFEPTRVEGPDGPELHARGAIDDKGNVAFHLLGIRAHLAATGRDTPAVTVKLLVEGEEESGSPHFADLLRERADRLACDVVVVSDTGMAAPDVRAPSSPCAAWPTPRSPCAGPPSTCTRAPSAARAQPAARDGGLLAALHDDDGRVTLPGFYDAVRPLTEHERELMARVPFDEAAWLAGPAASRVAAGEAGFSTLERIGARPTAEVNGMWGGYTGPGHKTIIPAEAHAKLTFRLVAGQRPEDVAAQVRVWVEQHLPEGIEADVHTPPGGVAPCASDLDSPHVGALLSAIGQAFDTDPADVLFTRRAAAAPRPTWSRCSARRWSSSAPGCPPTASTPRTSACCCRCCTAARSGGAPLAGAATR
jgi:acetylornithine deacetylase/succinyl-diaminopimelate desuccinylase-like protein